MKRGKKSKVNKRSNHQENSKRNALMNRMNNICFKYVQLKNFADEFNDVDIDEKSGFVEVFSSPDKRIVVKKTSLCWLLRSDSAKLSSDRLERVKGSKKFRVYNLRTLSKKRNNISLYKE